MLKSEIDLEKTITFQEFEELFGSNGKIRYVLGLAIWDFRPRIPFQLGETLGHAVNRFLEAKDSLHPS